MGYGGGILPDSWSSDDSTSSSTDSTTSTDDTTTGGGGGGFDPPDWFSKAATFFTKPRRTILGVIITTIVAYVVWFAEISVAGLLIAAGFDVGVPDAPKQVPGVSSGKWLVPPQEYFGPVDIPARIYAILTDVGAAIADPLMTFIVDLNREIASIAGGAGGVPALVQPLVVLLLWSIEMFVAFLALYWLVTRTYGLTKQLALDTLNPL